LSDIGRSRSVASADRGSTNRLELNREIYINESETVPLIGMQLLRGYDLRIQTIEGGLVTIEALK
jgi:hypothetical protein